MYLDLGNTTARPAPDTATSLRRRIADLIAARGHSLADASRAIGRNAAYLQQHITRGSPRRLPELERRHLAMFLGVDERQLGARDPWTPADA